MQIVDFPGTNAKIQEMGNAPCVVATDPQSKLKGIITAWMPSKDDLKAIKDGRPIFLQCYNNMPPTVMFTLDENGKPNMPPRENTAPSKLIKLG